MRDCGCVCPSFLGFPVLTAFSGQIFPKQFLTNVFFKDIRDVQVVLVKLVPLAGNPKASLRSGAVAIRSESCH